VRHRTPRDSRGDMFGPEDGDGMDQHASSLTKRAAGQRFHGVLATKEFRLPPA